MTTKVDESADTQSARFTTDEVLTQLLSVLARDQVKTAPDDLAHWGTDWSRSFRVDPSAIVFPKSTGDIVALTKLASRTGLALVPSGGRTGLSGGAVASHREVVVSFDRMNRILDFDSSDRLVRCQAGVVTAQLHEFAESKGLFYPVDFSSSGSSQIGGNIATNAGGIRVIRYGMTRDWVAGVTVVTGTGDVLQCNSGLMKNATGYDLRHLFIGSEGTLGFIVEAEIRLTRPPTPQSVMVLAFDNLDDVLHILESFQERIELSAFEFFSDLALRKVVEHRNLNDPFTEASPFYVLAEFDSSNDDVATETFVEVVNKGWATDGVISQSLAQAEALWQLRDGISESLAPQTPYKNDISVKIAEIPGFLRDVNAVVDQHYPDLEVCWFGHIGDGNLHLNILRPAQLSIDSFFERCHEISPILFDLIERRRGSISAEHGVGLLKRDFLGYSRSQAEIEVMRSIKDALDPAGIMNPGKLLLPNE